MCSSEVECDYKNDATILSLVTRTFDIPCIIRPSTRNYRTLSEMGNDENILIAEIF